MPELAQLPLGPRGIAAHGDGRSQLSVEGNRVVTVGSPYGHGPIMCAHVDEGGSLRVVGETDTGMETRATAVAIAHTGETAAVAEGSHYNIGLFSATEPETIHGLIHQASAEVGALAFTHDDQLL
jgi:hypothetical protein